MRIVLVGADMEENLGLCMISAASTAAGHDTRVVAFSEPGEMSQVVRRVLAHKPKVVGLGIQFQHRAHEFLTLARELRKAGYRGHLTAGGQWPTMAFREALGGMSCLDSIVLHEGERTMVELLDALEGGRELSEVAGLALRDASGEPVRTSPRPVERDLDGLPFARRYRGHSSHVGVPFIPMTGGRGCWGACAYCAITSGYRDARQSGALGPTFRQRSPKNVAAEMAALWHAAGSGAAVFCFHDDNFLLPKPEDSLRRVSEMRRWLDEFGVGKAAFVGKCRPDSVTAELARELRQLGVVRLYVGVENASQRSADHLNRKTQTARVREALEALRTGGIFACYNLLIFEPDATLDDVRQNIEFIRQHPSHPVNFCRVEPYHGTPLHRSLASRGILAGSHLGWDYRIADDRTELMYRICSAAFRERNFAAWGVANRYMGLGYSAKLIEYFYDDRKTIGGALVRRARALTESIALENAELLEKALRIAESVDLADEDAILRRTATLGLEISALDAVRHREIDELYADMREFSKLGGDRKPSAGVPRLLTQALSGLAMAGFVTLGPGCGETTEDRGPADAAQDVHEDPTVYDALPYDAGKDVAEDPTVADPLPWDSGQEPIDAAEDDPTVVDWAPPDGGLDGGSAMNDRTTDHWRDTSPKRAQRSRDLPLWDPPTFTLASKRAGDRVEVRIQGGPESISLRWEAAGEVIGTGREIEWVPSSEDDQLRLAVRAKGGVAVVSLRASEVEG